MARTRCVVKYCANYGKHKFPKDEARKRLWLKAIKHMRPGVILSGYSGVCSDHFRLTDFSVIPSYWNNYHPARVLRKTAVPSVFEWDKSSTQDQLPEELPPDHFLSLTVGKPSSSTQDTPSFNPNRVKATYSRGKSSNPNAVTPVPAPSPVPIQTPQQTQIKNTKTPNQLMEYKPKKYMTAQVDYDKIEDLTVTRFLCPGSVNNYEKRLKISSKPKNNSKTQDGPKLTPCLPPIVNINAYQEVGKLSTADILSNNNEFVENHSIFTSFLPLEVNIKTELEDEAVSSDFNFANSEENMLSSLSLPPEVIINPCLPPEVIIKTEKEDQPCNMIEVEIDMQSIKQEINDEITDNHL